MKVGDIALTPLPQSDGKLKHRPVLVLCEMPPFRDLLVCGIRTQVHQEVAGFDEQITANDADFAGSGLKASSLMRLGFLAVLPRNSFVGAIGAVAEARRQRLLRKLAEFLHDSSR